MEEPLLEGSISIQGLPQSHHVGKTTLMGAVFNFVCTTVGAGLVSLPGSLGQMGWLGLIFLFIVSVFSNYTAKILIECLHLVPEKTLRTYEDIGFECFGVKGRQFVAIIQNITLFGVSTIFLILIGANMNALISTLTLHDWIFIFALALLPFTWLKTMSEISILASFGVLASVIVSIVIIGQGINQYSTSSDPISSTAFDINGLSSGFNIIVFSFGFHAVLPHIEHEMIEPERFSTVANIACSIIFVIYAIVGSCGYLGYGDDVDSNVLESMDSDAWYVKIALVFITAHVTFAYPLPLNPICLALEEHVGINKLEGKKELTMRIIFRTGLVAMTVFVASVVPYFGDILSFLTSISVVFTAFIFPPVFYQILCARAGKPLPVEIKIYNLVILYTGIISSIAGLYYSTDALINDISDGGNPFDGFF